MSQKAKPHSHHPLKSLVFVLVAFLAIQTQIVCHSMASVPVKVGICQDEPNVYLDQQGKPAGFFSELLSAIAANEDWKLEYVPCSRDACLDKVESGELDLLMDVAFSETLAERAAAALTAAERIPVGDVEASLVVLLADADSGSEATGEGILAGVIPLDDTASLFVKLKAPATVVQRELEPFRKFLGSIRRN